jgi:hypothetical protein
MVTGIAGIALIACASLQNAISPPGIAKAAPESATPLAAPSVAMKGGRGEADIAYPADFGATVKPDGSIVFPQHTTGRVQGASLLVGGETVITVADDGSIQGVALKHRYRFDDDGALLDDQGHGIKIAPDGGVRAVGGERRYQTVFAWTPDGGAAWDKKAWHTLAIVSLVVIENMLPSALRTGDGGAHGDGGASKGLDIHIPPPSQWFK